MSTNLKIIQLNINSIKSRANRIEFNEFLKTHTPQIVLLSETKLNNKCDLLFPVYKIIRNDRNENSGGGTAICYSDALCCEYISVPKKISSFECTIARLKTKSGKNLILASIYKPPSKKINGKNVQVKINSKELNEIFLIDKNALYIVGGDFISNHTLWNSEFISVNGLNIYDWFQTSKHTHNISLYTSKNPTCKRSINGSHIDFGFMSSSIEILNCPSLTELPSEPYSDHAAIIMQIAIQPEIKKFEEIKNYKKANWTKLKNSVEKK